MKTKYKLINEICSIGICICKSFVKLSKENTHKS